MRHVQEPFTLRKHAALQTEINELMIAIKLHHTEPNPKMDEAFEKWIRAKEHHRFPTWENVLDILNRAYHALDEQRYNPIKY